MEPKLIKILEKLKFHYFQDLSGKNLEIIYNLFENNIIPDKPTGIIYYYLGAYYQNLNNSQNMIINYKFAIKNNILLAANNLGTYYIEHNINKAEKYLLTAIKLDIWLAYLNYANFLYIQARDEEANKYYLLSVKTNNPSAQNFYGEFLTIRLKNKTEANKYFLLAADQGFPEAMSNYANNLESDKNYDLAAKYYLMAFEHGISYALLELVKILKSQNKYDEILDLYSKYRRDLLVDFLNNNLSENLNSEKILNILSELSDQDLELANHHVKLINKLLKTKIDLLELNFKYRPGGQGYLEAKADFLARLKI